MRKALNVLAAAAVLATGGLALAGDCGGSAASGFGCQNMCPLAKSAGARRSFGNEGGVARQAAIAVMVQKALAKV